MAEQVLHKLTTRMRDIERIFDYYGEAAQVLKTLEELSECAEAISRDVKEQFVIAGGIDQNDEIDLTNSAYSEIADALIMLVQIAMLNPQKVIEIIDFKLDRTLKAVEEKEVK